MLEFAVISLVIAAVVVMLLRRLGLLVTARMWALSIVGTMVVIAWLWARAHG
ncbi:hypothetical protein [Actinoallomurus sp. NPDC050550]|uniref:hypothetical protein n=1 Tax=Actinoallomurus sp. NPDC050550 TaxID=3154937 RepID=UPI00340E42B8